MSNRREHKPNIRTIVQGASEPGTFQRASVPSEGSMEGKTPPPAPPQPEQEIQPKRTKIGYGLRDDLIKDFKQIALDQDKKIYEVIEDALIDYLKRYAKKHPDARLKSRLEEK